MISSLYICVYNPCACMLTQLIRRSHWLISGGKHSIVEIFDQVSDYVTA